MPKISTNLIGKAGLGLAMFHLARRGYDFTLTTMNSQEGDLWVRFEGGLEMVEVKATTTGCFHLRADQLARVSRVVFVLVSDGCCWCMPVETARAFVGERGGKVANITPKQVADLGAEAWHKQFPRLAPAPKLTGPNRTPGPVIPGAKGNRVVIKKLKNGRVKRYEYAPYNH